MATCWDNMAALKSIADTKKRSAVPCSFAVLAALMAAKPLARWSNLSIFFRGFWISLAYPHRQMCKVKALSLFLIERQNVIAIGFSWNIQKMKKATFGPSDGSSFMEQASVGAKTATPPGVHLPRQPYNSSISKMIHKK